MARSTVTGLSPALIRLIDIGGLCVSALCAVHCALTPVLLVVLPFLGWQSWETPLRLAAVGVGVSAVGLGALFHRNLKVVWPLLAGVALIGIASLLHGQLWLEVTASIAASVALMRAHWLNTRACASADHDCPPARIASSFKASHRHPHP